MNPRTYSLIAIVLLVSLYRIIPHPPNWSPVLALALFSGAHFIDRRVAVLVPVLAMLFADVIIGFHSSMLFVYLSIALLVFMGGLLQARKTAIHIGGASVVGSVVFFIITNFGAWLSLPGYYPRTASGLLEAYVAAIPFYTNTLLSTLFFAVILFGGYRVLEHFYPRLVSADNRL